jgi:hypothetical protein
VNGPQDTGAGAPRGGDKRRLVLHLGLWKTGTTTIQSFLRGNPEVLARIGVQYPRVGPENPDHPFFNPRPPTDFLAHEVSHQFLGRELVARKRRYASGLPLWSTALRMFEESGAHTAIISYEDFSAQVSQYRFDAIREMLKDLDVVGLIYLRPQESWAVSLYSHFVRGERTSLTFHEFIDSIRPRLTYSLLLDRIQDHIPLDRLIVRNFDDASRSGLIQDLFHSLDLPDALAASGYDNVVRNRSLPNWAVLFLLTCMRSSIETERIKDVRRALLRTAASRRAPRLSPGLDLASPAERTELRAIMSADAGRLAAKYGIMLPEPEPATAPYRPFSRDDIEAIRQRIAPRLPALARAALDSL